MISLIFDSTDLKLSFDGLISNFPFENFLIFRPRKSNPVYTLVILVLVSDSVKPLARKKSAMTGLTTLLKMSSLDPVTMKSSAYLTKWIL
jgi:hypothetical protein